jgi:pyruvate dehydrogenase E2 component (dihydrolipoamide acetyltransferase)/2-oxoglutarate dehydrogenase E2 component (dihydrolipoamide succinyltransferase)
MVDVIMPALGMAQDTGKLLQWLKQPGDPVAVGDQLFEVETDKSVMEVEASESGFLTQVSASDGDEVPVGQVIAVISATADNVVAAAAPKPAPVPDSVAEPQKTPVAPVAATVPAAAPMSSTGACTGRVLASPKAKRLAKEQDLDLGALVQAGHPQPYHVSDLEVLRSLPVIGASPSGQTVILVATKQITARCPRQGSRDFIDWMETDGAITVVPTAIFASFAAGAFRAATEAALVVVQVSGPDKDDVFLRNPDYSRLSVPAPETDNDATLVLHDLSDSFLTSLRLGDTTLPNLSIGADGDSYAITFEFSSEHMADDQAIAFVSGLARRLADPLHHLV